MNKEVAMVKSKYQFLSHSKNNGRLIGFHGVKMGGNVVEFQRIYEYKSCPLRGDMVVLCGRKDGHGMLRKLLSVHTLIIG